MSGVRVGCDVQDVASVDAAVRRFGQRYVDRVYSPAESTAAAGDAARLAARFAAKEAVLKLIGDPDGLDLRDIEIRTDPRGRPQVHLHGDVRRRADAQGVHELDVSLTHSAGVAMAVAVAVTLPHHQPTGATR